MALKTYFQGPKTAKNGLKTIIRSEKYAFMFQNSEKWSKKQWNMNFQALFIIIPIYNSLNLKIVIKWMIKKTHTHK